MAPHCAKWRTGLPDAAGRFRSARQSRAAGSRSDARDRRRLHRDDARPLERVDFASACSACREERRAVAGAGQGSAHAARPAIATRATTAACCARYCDDAQQFRRGATTSWPCESPTIAQRLRVPVASAGGDVLDACAASSKPCASRGPSVPFPIGRVSHIGRSPMRQSQPCDRRRFVRRHRAARVSRQAGSAAVVSSRACPADAASRLGHRGKPRRQPFAASCRTQAAKGVDSHQCIARSSVRTASAVVGRGASTWPAAAARLRAEERGDGIRIAGVEFALAHAPFR